jgi:hypothetical protein
MIKIEKTSERPTVFRIRFEGLLTLAETQAAARELIAAMQQLSGRRFRIVCEMAKSAVMSEAVAEVFMATQNIAVESGMERDAFVINSPTARMQIARIARTGKRFEALGAVHFFDDLAEAEAFLLA